MSKRKKRPLTPEQQTRLVGRLRIGDLNRLWGSRYGGGRENYVFPDDDAGIEDLSISLQHYARSNPIKIPKIIALRAPWMGEDEIALLLDQITAYPRQWKAESLGCLLRVTTAEWRLLDLRTIAPADMTKQERTQERKLRGRLRKRLRRRAMGKDTRAEYLAANSISRTRPWEAEGISRKTWYKRRKQAANGRGDKSVPHIDSLNAADTPVTPGKPTSPKGIVWKNASAAASVPEVSTAEIGLAA